MRAFAAYVSGELDNLAGHPARAEEHYDRAVDLARSSGASFVIGIAAVGLLSVRVDAGRIHEALHGYRDVIDYWDRSGNWTQQWVTLRNLAELLRRLGDDEPAALLEAAAKSPDAPAASPTASPESRRAARSSIEVPPSKQRGRRSSATSTHPDVAVVRRVGAPRSPPVDRWSFMHLACGDLDVAHVAELPELFGSTGVLEQHLVDVERVQFTVAESVDRLGHVRDEFGELRLVVARHRLACLPTL